MSAPTKCKTCGCEVSASALEGLCPDCLGRLVRADPPANSPAPAPTQPGVTDIVPDPSGEQPGDRIGNYRLLQKIGEGGFGVVYMAEQEQPVRRRVALKVIKLGMDTRQVVARFEAERQALALMDHTNIARVLDAGATNAGRPYFVMELVKGVKITQYCNQNHLALNARLDLFVQICHAIQHAHQKGIIHRDIKPSNVMVTMHDGVPVPKVIDFGIAKATEMRLTDKTLFTQYEQFMGTPAYMSPEQAEMTGLDIDTRSDIYSLGVLLYELLTGRPPFSNKDLVEKGIEEARRTIRETDPPRPSTRLSTLAHGDLSLIARERSSEGPRLLSLVRGDLDWIVMKCLEKDRTRRYETANGLAMDLTRYLTNEPIVARPPSTAYRLQKLVRRNRAAFAATGVVTAALVVGVFVSTWQAIRATRAEREKAGLLVIANAAKMSEEKLRKASEERLYDSLVSEARHKRREHRVGYRDEVFRIVQQANALDVPHKNLAELRSAAVACMGDLAGFSPVILTNFPADTRIRQTVIDPTGQFALFRLMDGTVLMFKLSSGELIDRFVAKPAGGWFHFDATGDRLYYNYFVRPGWLQVLWRRATDGHWREEQNTPLPDYWQLDKSKDGQFGFMADGAPGSHKLVDLETKNVVLRFDLPDGVSPSALNGAWLSPDGRFLAMVWIVSILPQTFGIDLWDVSTGRNIKRFETGLRKLASLDFSSDGRYLACLAESGGAIYAMDRVERVAEFTDSFKPGTASFGFSNTVIALPIQSQSRVRLWDWVNKRDMAVLDEPEEPREARFAPDGSFLLTSGRWSARLYRWPARTEKLTLPKFLLGGWLPAAFSADGSRLALIREDRQLNVLDAATGRTLWKPESPGVAPLEYGPALALSSDRLLAAAPYGTKQIQIWDERDRKLVATLGTNEPGLIGTMEFTPDGQHLIALITATDGRAGDMHVKAWRLSRNVLNPAESGLQVRLVLDEHIGKEPTDLAVSPNNRHFALGTAQNNDPLSTETEIRVWDLEGAPPRLVSTNARFTFTRDGKELLTIGRNLEIVAINVETASKVAPPISVILSNSPPEMLYAGRGRLVALSPNGTRLAVAAADGRRLDIWDWPGRRHLYSLPEQDGVLIRPLIWSPDSQRMIVGNEFGGAVLWNIQEVEQVLAKLGLNP